jgi:hypothetical protein
LRALEKVAAANPPARPAPESARQALQSTAAYVRALGDDVPRGVEIALAAFGEEVATWAAEDPAAVDDPAHLDWPDPVFEAAEVLAAALDLNGESPNVAEDVYDLWAWLRERGPAVATATGGVRLPGKSSLCTTTLGTLRVNLLLYMQTGLGKPAADLVRDLMNEHNPAGDPATTESGDDRSE